MDDKKKCVRLIRQLDSESKLLKQLQGLCDQFSSIIQQSTAQSPNPLDLKPAEQLLADFVSNAGTVVDARKKTLDLINQDHFGENPLTIRQFIRQSPEPIRTQLESKRSDLVDVMNNIRVQVTGDSAVVFYSFDFYRRIVNSLVDCIAEEQGYDQGGKTAQKNTGKFFQKAC